MPRSAGDFAFDSLARRTFGRLAPVAENPSAARVSPPLRTRLVSSMTTPWFCGAIHRRCTLSAQWIRKRRRRNDARSCLAAHRARPLPSGAGFFIGLIFPFGRMAGASGIPPLVFAGASAAGASIVLGAITIATGGGSRSTGGPCAMPRSPGSSPSPFLSARWSSSSPISARASRRSSSRSRRSSRLPSSSCSASSGPNAMRTVGLAAGLAGALIILLSRNAGALDVDAPFGWYLAALSDARGARCRQCLPQTQLAEGPRSAAARDADARRGGARHRARPDRAGGWPARASPSAPALRAGMVADPRSRASRPASATPSSSACSRSAGRSISARSAT